MFLAIANFIAWLSAVAVTYPTEVMVAIGAGPLLFEIAWFVWLAVRHRQIVGKFSAARLGAEIPRLLRTSALYYLNEAVDVFYLFHDRERYHLASYLFVLALGGGIGVLFSLLTWPLAVTSVVLLLYMLAFLILNWCRVKRYLLGGGAWRKVHVITVVVFLTAISGCMATSYYWLNAQIGDLFDEGEWPHLTAPQSVILLEYSVVVLIHATQVLLRLDRTQAPDAIYHLGVTALGVFIVYQHAETGIDRFHHDFLGLLLQIFPFVSVRAIGFAYTIDSMLYIWVPGRLFDFSDIVVNYPGVVLGCATANLAPQFCNWCFYQLIKHFKSGNIGDHDQYVAIQ
jgi:hypothetical protein